MTNFTISVNLGISLELGNFQTFIFIFRLLKTPIFWNVVYIRRHRRFIIIVQDYWTMIYLQTIKPSNRHNYCIDKQCHKLFYAKCLLSQWTQRREDKPLLCWFTTATGRWLINKRAWIRFGKIQQSMATFLFSDTHQ